MWYSWLQIILDHSGDYRIFEQAQTLWLFNNKLPMLLALILGCCIVCVLHSLITGWIPLEADLFLLFWLILMLMKIFFPPQPKNLLNLLLSTSEVAFKMAIATEVLCHNDTKLWSLALKANRPSTVRGRVWSLEKQMCYYEKWQLVVSKFSWLGFSLGRYLLHVPDPSTFWIFLAISVPFSLFSLPMAKLFHSVSTMGNQSLLWTEVAFKNVQNLVRAVGDVMV